MVMPVRFTLQDVSTRRRPRFAVTGHFADGQSRPVGLVEYLRIRHLERPDSRVYKWVATATDDSHRAVHHERWEAVWACGWDGSGTYPFPVDARHRPLVEAA